MTEYRFSFELSNRHRKAESPGLSVFDPTGRRSGSITLAAGNATILAPTIAEYCFEKIQRAECILTSGADVALINSRFTTWRGLNGWFVETPGVPPVVNFYTNAIGDPTIRDDFPVNGDRKDVLQITGAAAAALGDLTGPGNVEFHVDVSRTAYFSSPSYAQQSSSIVFDDFLDDMEFTLPNLAGVAAKRLKTIQNQGGGLVVLAETVNQKITVPSCCAALGFQRPFIVAADIGNGFGQIPALPANWTAAAFKPHPRLFVRPSNNTGWAIQHLGPAPIGNPPLTLDTDLFPALVARAPTHSAWRIGLDGTIKDVIIAHPANSDIRRPRDVWRKVWAPAIASDAAIDTFAYYFIGFAPNLTRAWYSRGVLSGLEYLDFAYCLDLFDSDGGTPLVQFPEI